MRVMGMRTNVFENDPTKHFTVKEVSQFKIFMRLD